DLKTLDFLDKVLDAGVRVLKIEGRGRSPEYVKVVTRVYRQAVDAWLNGEWSSEKLEQWNKDLSTVYNRGFWDGYYLGQRVGEWSKKYGSQATTKKTFVGTVTNYFKNIGVAEVKIETGCLEKGNRIYIMGTTTGVYEDTIEEIRVDLQVTDKANKGEFCSIPTKSLVRRGDKLYVIEDVVLD
ncbi:MAG: U32 family peptidase, partial [Bacteroidales bacterium]|nr:U32 family peptidase [Bacteroidales bacterium]